jgi:hypothetical protein
LIACTCVTLQADVTGQERSDNQAVIQQQRQRKAIECNSHPSKLSGSKCKYSSSMHKYTTPVMTVTTDMHS